MALVPPTFGPYTVEGKIGVGGMATVVRARHQMLGRRVAIKYRPKTRGPHERTVAERFRQGAILQSRLNHPHITQIYEYFEGPDYQVLVMEYLGGGSVEEHLKATKGPLPIGDAVEIALHAALALDFAHNLGVIHRDIKPDNLLLLDQKNPNSVRVTDYGVAKTEQSPDLTIAGANIGTLWYMPPEQFNQEKPTPLADVYSLGATLYEMLTGHIPFRSQEHSEIFRRFLDGVPPPSIRGRNPKVPRTLAAVVDGALALSIEERTPSAGALALLLRAVSDREGLSQGDGPIELLLRAIDVSALQALLHRVPGPEQAQLADALGALESRLIGGNAVQSASFDAVQFEDLTPYNLDVTMTLSEDDDAAESIEDDDRTMVMMVPYSETDPE